MFNIDASTALSIVAVVISAASSVLTIYLQFFRVVHPQIDLLDDGNVNRSVLLKYSDLPQAIRDMYPEYPEPNPYYCLIDLHFINIGGRVGYARIIGLTCDRFDIKASYYNTREVPAGSISSSQVLLRNLPTISEVTTATVLLDGIWGGVSRHNRQFRKPLVRKVRVALHPPNV